MAYEYQLTCDATQINGIVALFVRFLSPRFFGTRTLQKINTNKKQTLSNNAISSKGLFWALTL